MELTDIDLMELLGIPRRAQLVLALLPAETGTDRPFIIARSDPGFIYCRGSISGKQRETCARVLQALEFACLQAEKEVTEMAPFGQFNFYPIPPKIITPERKSQIYLDMPGISGHTDDMFIGIRCDRIYMSGTISAHNPGSSIWTNSYRKFKGAYMRALSDVIEIDGAKPENQSLFEDLNNDEDKDE